jgi:hypothetical protein
MDAAMRRKPAGARLEVFPKDQTFSWVRSIVMVWSSPAGASLAANGSLSHCGGSGFLDRCLS